MITICFHGVGASQSTEAWSYRVAARSVLSDAPVPKLAAFLENRNLPFQWPEPLPVPMPEPDRRIYQGPGWLGNEWREVTCWAATGGYVLAVAGIGRCWVADDGTLITPLHREPNATENLVREVVIGPALILALALQGSWCLHASAAVLDGQAVAFAGESGSGKSTLAAFLGGEGAPRWRRIGDDVLPLAPAPEGIDALPHFPQLKLPPGAQPSMGLPERLPLRAVYLLDAPGERPAEPAIEPLEGRQASLALVRHTVAARLFDGNGLREHLAFCAQAAARVPVRHLSLPGGLEHLSGLKARIEANIADT